MGIVEGQILQTGSNLLEIIIVKGTWKTPQVQNFRAGAKISYVINNPNSHCGFHHQTFSSAQDASQSTPLQSWCRFLSAQIDVWWLEIINWTRIKLKDEVSISIHLQFLNFSNFFLQTLRLLQGLLLCFFQFHQLQNQKRIYTLRESGGRERWLQETSLKNHYNNQNCTIGSHQLIKFRLVFWSHFILKLGDLYACKTNMDKLTQFSILIESGSILVTRHYKDKYPEYIPVTH